MVINFKLTKNIIFCFKEMTTSADNVDFSDLLPQEVFSFASRDQLKKCKSTLENTEEGDPVLVISPNQAWINQYNLPSYTAAMNTFATFNLARNQQPRDGNSGCIFNFRDMAELYQIRDAIKEQNLIPNGFSVLPSLVNFHLNMQQEPLGKAWIIVKINPTKLDFGEDLNFFNL